MTRHINSRLSQLSSTIMTLIKFLSLLLVIVFVTFDFNYVFAKGIRLGGNEFYGHNRTRRQARRPAPNNAASTSAAAVVPWQRIYLFSMKLAKAFGNNALLANLNDMITAEMGSTSKAYCGGRSYGGYSYSQPPIQYVQPIQYVIMDTGVFDFTSGFGGGGLSNNALLEQLISLIQTALDDTYTNYEEEST